MRTRRQSARSSSEEDERSSCLLSRASSSISQQGRSGDCTEAYDELGSCSEALSEIPSDGEEREEPYIKGEGRGSYREFRWNREIRTADEDEGSSEEKGRSSNQPGKQSYLSPHSPPLSPSALSLSFLEKTYRMIDGAPPHLASWSLQSDSFIIFDPPNFAREVIPRYFRHNKFASFVRQLNFYGFRKLKVTQSYGETTEALAQRSQSESGGHRDDRERKHVLPPEKDWWQFYHERFIYGRKDLLQTIKRRTYHPANMATRRAERLCAPDEASLSLLDVTSSSTAFEKDKALLSAEVSSHPSLSRPSSSHYPLTTERSRGAKKRKSDVLEDVIALQEEIPALLSTVKAMNQRVQSLNRIFRVRLDKMQASNSRETERGRRREEPKKAHTLSSSTSSCQSPPEPLVHEQPTLEPRRDRQSNSRELSSLPLRRKANSALSSSCASPSSITMKPSVEKTANRDKNYSCAHSKLLTNGRKCSDTLIAAEVLANFWCLSGNNQA